MKAQAIAYLLVLVALFAVPAAAQITVEVLPPNPTTADEVILRVLDINTSSPDVTRTGNHFRLDFFFCPILCPASDFDVTVGTLPAGTYTYEVFLDGTSEASGGFVVAQAALPNTPTLSPAAMIALCLMLVGAGWVFIGRQT